MQIIKTPGLNGLNKTIKTRNAGNQIISATGRGLLMDIEEIHVDNSNLDEQDKLIYENSVKAFETQNKAVFLGGDHSISYPIGRGFLKVFGAGESFLIVFDAHPDCMPPMKQPTHEEWLRALVENGWKSENIILAGLRKIEPEELEFLSKNKIRYYKMSDIQNIEFFCDAIMEQSQGKNLYVSVDIDVVDPSFAPGTYYQEPGGFSSREILYIARRLSKMKNLRGFDIAEVFEEDTLTVKLASRILQELV